jgi:hypothetical protein
MKQLNLPAQDPILTFGPSDVPTGERVFSKDGGLHWRVCHNSWRITGRQTSTLILLRSEEEKS